MNDAHSRDPFCRLVYFVTERERVRLNKEALRLPRAQWTRDEILQTYRFTNVRREDDRVTRWIVDNWREPYRGEPDLWHAMCVARLINEPSTLEKLGRPGRWSRSRLELVVRKLKADGERWLNPAYIVSTNGRAVAKEEHIAGILEDLWTARRTLRPTQADTLCSYHMTLGACYGLGSFMAAQVVADLKYVLPLKNASDWYTFAASGPGSRRGLNRLLERPKDSKWREDEWRLSLGRLQVQLNDALRWDEPLHAQDVQNCLCEFDKMERARLGEGRPKQKYRPRTET